MLFAWFQCQSHSPLASLANAAAANSAKSRHHSVHEVPSGKGLYEVVLIGPPSWSSLKSVAPALLARGSLVQRLLSRLAPSWAVLIHVVEPSPEVGDAPHPKLACARAHRTARRPDHSAGTQQLSTVSSAVIHCSCRRSVHHWPWWTVSRWTRLCWTRFRSGFCRFTLATLRFLYCWFPLVFVRSSCRSRISQTHDLVPHLVHLSGSKLYMVGFFITLLHCS